MLTPTFNFDYLDQRHLTEGQIVDINALLKQLTSKPKEVSMANLKEVLGQSGVFILTVSNLEGKIIGMATLAVRSLLLNRTAIIGDVVVDKEYRGMKLGKKIMEALVRAAKSEEVSFISLTSHPDRKEANYLYQNLGFKLIGKVGESNYYRLPL